MVSIDSVARWPEFRPNMSKGAGKNVFGPEKWWLKFSRFLSKVAEKGPEKFLEQKLLYFEKKEGLILYHLMDLFRKYLFQQENL